MIKQNLMNRLTGRIRCVRNTALTMPALPREVQTHWAIFVGSKGHALINQPLNRCCTFFRNIPRSRFHY